MSEDDSHDSENCILCQLDLNRKGDKTEGTIR